MNIGVDGTLMHSTSLIMKIFHHIWWYVNFMIPDDIVIIKMIQKLMEMKYIDLTFPFIWRIYLGMYCYNSFNIQYILCFL